jgi:uncharacterized membrane protein YqgA involved in biofilm formation
VIGLGTAINVVAILIGSAIGVALGSRLPERVREVVTDGLGLVTLLVAALSAAAVLDPALSEAVGSGGVLIVLGAVLIGGIIGSLLRVEERLESLGETIRDLALRRRRRRSASGSDSGSSSTGADAAAAGPGRTDADAPGGADPADDPEHAATVRFVEGFVTASLVFCVGPLAILGALSDGLGRGMDQLALKSVLDGFASVAFAATLGWGVAASALVVLLYQGAWTLLGWSLGGVLPDAEIAAITATGGLLLAAIGIRLLRLRPIPVGDLLPALIVAPLLVAVVAALR